MPPKKKSERLELAQKENQRQEMLNTIQSLAKVPTPPSPLPVFTGAEMSKAFDAYRDLQKALDKSMPDQIMTIQGKPFRKKGYWRAIRTSFNLQVECIYEEKVQLKDADWGYVVTYKATAPNGSSATGDGSCAASDKHGKRCTLHNVRSHAHTRAFNRAVSNLVGFGECSAEEVNYKEADNGAKSTPAQYSQRQQEIEDQNKVVEKINARHEKENLQQKADKQAAMISLGKDLKKFACNNGMDPAEFDDMKAAAGIVSLDTLTEENFKKLTDAVDGWMDARLGDDKDFGKPDVDV